MGLGSIAQFKLNNLQGKEAEAVTERQAVVGLNLLKTYRTTSLEVAKTLDLQKDQLRIAEASGAGPKLAAQEQARYNELIRETKSAEDASRVAAGDRVIAQAQLTAGAKDALFSLQNQAAASAAVGTQEKIKAQAAATYNQVLRDTKNASLAAATAAQQEANARAQVVAAGQEALWQLQNQAQVSAAVTGNEKIKAQYAATYKQVLRETGDASLAIATATQQETNSRAQASAAVEQQTRALDDQTALIEARRNGTEATVAAEQAYKNAIDSGASSLKASALAEATRRNIEAKQAEQLANRGIKKYSNARPPTRP